MVWPKEQAKDIKARNSNRIVWRIQKQGKLSYVIEMCESQKTIFLLKSMLKLQIIYILNTKDLNSDDRKLIRGMERMLNDV